MVLDQVSFSVSRGELLGVIGASGSGKSSLLHLLAALDRPAGGQIWCDGVEVNTLSGLGAARYRNYDVGYVWQFHYLLPEFTACENVAMPLLARATGARKAIGAATAALERVGLADRLHHRAGELSGGEQQRVALARALVTGPKLLLADEPTGDLDEATARDVFLLIQALHREAGLTTVLVTHNLLLARRCDRVLRLKGGRLQPATPGELDPAPSIG